MQHEPEKPQQMNSSSQRRDIAERDGLGIVDKRELQGTWMDEDMRPEEGERRGNPTDELLTPYTSFTVPWLRRLQPVLAPAPLTALGRPEGRRQIWRTARVGCVAPSLVDDIGLLAVLPDQAARFPPDTGGECGRDGRKHSRRPPDPPMLAEGVFSWGEGNFWVSY